MTSVFGSIWWLIVSIGILVTFHEFGHFCVARFFGVHVLRFSVGFGKPLLTRVGADGTEYVVSAIPLGGYVKMLDEREYEVPEEDLDRCHNRKPVWQRMLIAVAGPAFNFLLCFALFWATFIIGQPDYLPIVGEAHSLAAEGGFLPGDRLRRIGDEPVETWTDTDLLLVSAVMDRKPLQVVVSRPDGGTAIRSLDLSKIPSGLDTEKALERIGFKAQQALEPPVIVDIDRTGPLDRLRLGDRILSIDGVQAKGIDDVPRLVQTSAKAGIPLHLLIQRDKQQLAIDVVPQMRTAGKAPPHLAMGITVAPPPHDGIRHYGPIAALGASADEMRRETLADYSLVRRLFIHGETQDLSGVVGIAQAANMSAQRGAAWFLYFLGILSLSLGILNLLPVPILDGGHLLYYLIELVKGRPLSDRTLMVGQFVGLVLLGGLMCVAFYNDLLRLAS